MTTTTEDDICVIAKTIWETLFSVPLDLVVAEPAIAGPVVTGCVTIEGAWDGAVILTCQQELADTLTAHLFGAGPPASDDVRDTVGEVTNMIAGNFKALLPDPSRMSLPTVAFGAHYGVSVVGTTQTAVLRFRCGDGLLQVSVHKGRLGGDA
jgi:chemotaxis protein CheX